MSSHSYKIDHLLQGNKMQSPFKLSSNILYSVKYTMHDEHDSY